MGRAWWQELKAPGHNVSTFKEQREMSAGVPDSFSYLFFLIQSRAPRKYRMQSRSSLLSYTSLGMPSQMCPAVHLPSNSKFSEAEYED